MPLSRDEVGRVVRDAWVEFAKLDPKSPPHHLTPYDECDEKTKEADRRIGEAVVQYVIEKIRVSSIAHEGPQEIHCGGCQGHA